MIRMLKDTNWEWATVVPPAVEEIYCDYCEEEVYQCDWCGKYFEEGDEIICALDGSCHFCSEECMRKYFNQEDDENEN